MIYIIAVIVATLFALWLFCVLSNFDDRITALETNKHKMAALLGRLDRSEASHNWKEGK